MEVVRWGIEINLIWITLDVHFCFYKFSLILLSCTMNPYITNSRVNFMLFVQERDFFFKFSNLGSSLLQLGNIFLSAAAAKSLQSCPTLCDPIDGSPPGSPIPGILQARTLEWVAISFSNACKWKVKVKSLSRVRLLATPWTAAYQAPPSMGFSRQKYWSGVPLPSPISLSTSS